MRTLLLDLAAPVAVHYVLHAAGADHVTALVAGAVPPLLHAVVTAVRRRRAEPVALVVLAASALSLLAGAVTGDARELLVRGAWISAPFSLLTLASLLRAQPLCFVVTRGMLPGRADAMDRRWGGDPGFRRAWRRITAVWGVAALADAAARIAMAATLPVAVVPALDTALSVVTVVLLQVPTHVLLHRAGAWQALFGRVSAGAVPVPTPAPPGPR